MSLFLEQQAFLKQVPLLITRAFKMGFQVTGGELMRTTEQQALYVKTGRSQTMHSNHLLKCAIDLNLFPKDSTVFATFEEVKPLGIYWDSLDPKNRWGGNFKKLVDTPHFERNVA